MFDLHVGDVRDVLPTLPDQSVQCVVTSPPYWGLRNYDVNGQLGLEATPEEYVANMVAVFREVRRVLRDDGTCWVNLGDSYAQTTIRHRRHELQDQWVTGGNFGQSADRLIDNSFSTVSSGLKPKDLVGMPWRLAFALQADGWYLRADIIWAKGLSFCDSYSGSVMPESVTDRPTKGHEYVFLLTKSARYYYDADAVREPHFNAAPPDGPPRGRDGVSASSSKNQGWQGFDRSALGKHNNYNPMGRNIRSVWAINPQPFSEAHFATYPQALVEPCIKAGSRKGDTVLDPFTGSGTTGIVALRHGRKFVGIELNQEYADMARLQIGGPLFAAPAL